MANKKCTKCKVCKPLTDYYESAIEPDGRFHKCKVCCKTSSGTSAKKTKQRAAHYTKILKAGDKDYK